MRTAMIDGSGGWSVPPSRVGKLIEQRQGDGFLIEQRRAALGVVGSSSRVARTSLPMQGAGNSNTAVFRIGAHALLRRSRSKSVRSDSARAGLPEGAQSLLRNKEYGGGPCRAAAVAICWPEAAGSRWPKSPDLGGHVHAIRQIVLPGATGSQLCPRDAGKTPSPSATAPADSQTHRRNYFDVGNC